MRLVSFERKRGQHVILGNVPLLGRFFRSESSRIHQNRLYVFLTPWKSMVPVEGIESPEQARRLGLSATRAWTQGGAVRGTGETSGASARSGALAAVGCYLLWGLVPLYWKRLAAIDSLELIAHRHLWSLALLALLMVFRGEGWGSAVAALSTVRSLGTSRRR